jgi:hypothetical protein
MERYDKLSDLLERERQTFRAALSSLNLKRESEVHSLSQEIVAKQRIIEELRLAKEVRSAFVVCLCCCQRSLPVAHCHWRVTH